MDNNKPPGARAISNAQQPQIQFSASEIERLHQLGLTHAQCMAIQRRLVHIRAYVSPAATKKHVRAPLEKFLSHVRGASDLLERMRSASTEADREAGSCLVQGAADLTPSLLCTEIETADDGAVPERIDPATLIHLLVAAADRAIEVHAPKQRRAPSAPAPAIRQIVAALRQPRDLESKASAAELAATRSAGSGFVDLCSLVFDAASGGKLRNGAPPKDGHRGDVDRAIRAYMLKDARPIETLT